MRCPDCGYVFEPFEETCPRCARLGTDVQDAPTHRMKPAPAPVEAAPPRRPDYTLRELWEMPLYRNLVIVFSVLGAVGALFAHDALVHYSPLAQSMSQVTWRGRHGRRNLLDTLACLAGIGLGALLAHLLARRMIRRIEGN